MIFQRFYGYENMRKLYSNFTESKYYIFLCCLAVCLGPISFSEVLLCASVCPHPSVVHRCVGSLVHRCVGSIVHRCVGYSAYVASSCIGVTAAAVAVVEQKLCYTCRVFVLASKFPKFSENVTDFHRSR